MQPQGSKLVIKFEYTYAQLPERFFQRLGPTRFSEPSLLKWNHNLAADLGLGQLDLSDSELADIFSGKSLPQGARPIAQAYSGHQFEVFNPNLGDGRAMLLGEIIDRSGNRRDVHLKGSGPTQYSRRGDGLANLAAVIREYILGEALYGLKIPCSRALAIISTGESVIRETQQPGAILVRVASSHIRIGTFEHFVARNDLAGAKTLMNYAIDRHFPELEKNKNGYLEFLERVVELQASLVANWLSMGFIHGVMNTDNTFVSGETIDFGPCAFLEEFDSGAVFSSIDRTGRYAFGNQPGIMKWNLSKLATCIESVLGADGEVLNGEANRIVDHFEVAFEKFHLRNLANKFGFVEVKSEERSLITEFFEILQTKKMDFTLSFRCLGYSLDEENREAWNLNQYSSDLSQKFESREVKNWLARWKAQIAASAQSVSEVKEGILRFNPAVIPRNHLVEKTIVKVLQNHDWNYFSQLVDHISNPYLERSSSLEFMRPASEGEKVLQTFCNT